MKKAIENAVYFSNSGNNYTKVVELEYTDKKSFSKIIHSLPNNIDIIRFFEPRDNICYTIFNHLESLFERIFLDQVSSICLVNARDLCIQINRIDETDKKQKYAIIKLDSVLAEYYKNSSYSKLFYPLFFLFGVATGIIGLEYLKNY